MSYVSSPKDSVFPETIPEEASSVEEERVVIFQLPIGGCPTDPAFYTADASLLHQSTSSRRGSKQLPLQHQTQQPFKDRPEKTATKFDFDRIDTFSVCILTKDNRVVFKQFYSITERRRLQAKNQLFH